MVKTMQNPLLWHHGLPLEPQHFQQNDLFYKSFITKIYHYFSPFSWGLLEKISIPEKFKNKNLKGQNFYFSKGSFLFKDITFVAFDENDKNYMHSNSVLKNCKIDDKWKSQGEQNRITIYLALKSMEESQKNVTEVINLKPKISSSYNTRFVVSKNDNSKYNIYKDIHLDEGVEKKVQKLYYFLEIIGEHELLNDNNFNEDECIPIAQLIETKNNELYLCNDYIPPCVNIQSSDELFEIIKNIKNDIKDICIELEKYKNEGGVSSVDFNSSSLNYYLYMRIINRFYISFSHLFNFIESKKRYIHPLYLYEELISFIGEISTFTTKISVSDIDIDNDNSELLFYDHYLLYDCFSNAQKIIKEMLNTKYIPEKRIELKKIKDLRANLDIELLNLVNDLSEDIYINFEAIKYEQYKQTSFSFVIKTNSKLDDNIQNIEKQIKLCHINKIEDIIRRDIPGIKLSYIYSSHNRPPYSYRFKIQNKEDLNNESYIGLFCPVLQDDVQISLIIKDII